ncbi:MAG: hypothetical protein AAGJ46_13550 [Planctomycetota bacterium]
MSSFKGMGVFNLRIAAGLRLLTALALVGGFPPSACACQVSGCCAERALESTAEESPAGNEQGSCSGCTSCSCAAASKATPQERDPCCSPLEGGCDKPDCQCGTPTPRIGIPPETPRTTDQEDFSAPVVATSPLVLHQAPIAPPRFGDVGPTALGKRLALLEVWRL